MISSDAKNAGGEKRCPDKVCLICPMRRSMMKAHMRMTFCLQGEKGASIEVLVDGEESGILRLDQDQPTLTEIGIMLVNSAGEHDMVLRMTGSVLIDWFSLTA